MSLRFKFNLVLAGVLLLAVLVTSLCLREDGPLFTVLAWRPLKAIGVVSYGMYLMHMLAVNLVVVAVLARDLVRRRR